MSTSSPISTFLTTLFQFAKTDELKLIAPALGTFFTNVGSNPSPLNLANQALLLKASLLATLPQLEQDVIKEIDMLVQASIQTVLATQTPATPTA